ncbi:MAG: hypothetical protein LAT68_03390 [Cyclobacteriaceae bacterium]|nr:hypothetical protein [Cyclobacteriaceae bacterium]MCH8515352.1 hypothetical protein [Cyclobacteriaceae bacterium]
MSRILSIALLFLLNFVAFTGCRGPEGPPGPQGPAGPAGDGGELQLPQVWDVDIVLDVGNQFFNIFEVPIEVLPSDIALVYYLDFIEFDNNGEIEREIYTLLPHIYEDEVGGQPTDIEIKNFIDLFRDDSGAWFMDIELLLISLGEDLVANNYDAGGDFGFRIVYIPADFSPDARLDFTDYQQVKEIFNLPDEPEKLDKRTR